jgi:hypothetical protein
MKPNKKCGYFFLVLMLVVIVYFVTFDDYQEGFTSHIRGLYNPRVRQIRMYKEQLQKQAVDYVSMLKKSVNWLK